MSTLWHNVHSMAQWHGWMAMIWTALGILWLKRAYLGRKEALLVTLVTHPVNPNVNERVLRMHCWELQAYSSESLISCFFLNSTSHADGLATTSVPCFIRACSLPVSISPSILKSLINDQNGWPKVAGLFPSMRKCPVQAN